MQPEVIPAILVKTREDLLLRISQVIGLVKEIQLDIMDGVFVPNKTVGLDDLKGLPSAKYEFHWMVANPELWIEKTPGPHMHLVHVETITSFEKIEAAVKKAGGSLGLAINPETPLEKLLPHIRRAKRVLVMTVHPGFSGQKYIFAMGEKIKRLRSLYPALDIEVDGGVNLDTVSHAYSCGANILAAASAIFSADSIPVAIEDLKKRALAGVPSS
jgi:ribulose-phosphate 3-epimerase